MRLRAHLPIRRWRPSLAGPSVIVGEMDPGRADLLTASGGLASSLLDAAGSGRAWAGAGSTRPALTTGTGGHACLVSSSSTHTSFRTTTGPTVGGGAHWIVAALEFANGGDGSEIGSAVNHGAPGNCTSLGLQSGQLWGGGSGQGDPLADIDAALHVVAMTHDGTGVMQLWIAGEKAGSPDQHTWTLAAGTGIFAYSGSFLANAKIYLAIFGLGELAHGNGSLAWRMDRYVARKIPEARTATKVVVAGDSLVDGTNANTIAVNLTLVPQLQAALAAAPYSVTADCRRHGFPGARTDEILAVMDTSVNPDWTALAEGPGIFVLWGATNDARELTNHFGGEEDAAVLNAQTSITAILASARAAGANLFFLLTLHKTGASEQDPGVERVRVRINAWLATVPGATVIDVAGMGILQDPDDGAWYVDAPSGTHLTPAAQALVAAFAAPLIAPHVAA